MDDKLLESLLEKELSKVIQNALAQGNTSTTPEPLPLSEESLPEDDLFEEIEEEVVNEEVEDATEGYYDDDWDDWDDAEEDIEVTNPSSAQASSQSWGSSKGKPEFTEPDIPVVHNSDAQDLEVESVVKSLNEQLLNAMREHDEMAKTVVNETEFFNKPDTKQLQKDVKDVVFHMEQPFERIVSEPYQGVFNGQTFNIQRYQNQVNFGNDLVLSDNFEDNAKNLRSISQFIVQDISRMFGGLDRITDFAIISDILIFNSVSYEPILPESYIASLPIDIQNSVRAGCLAWLFDFYELRNMPNLVNLLFDNKDFVFKKVRVDLELKRSFEPSDLFKICKSLLTLQLGELVVTRDDAYMGVNSEVFTRQRRSTELADTVDKWFVRTSKNSWLGIKDYYRNSDSRLGWKLAGSALRVGVAATSSIGMLGFKAARNTPKMVSAVKSGLSAVVSALREDI